MMAAQMVMDVSQDWAVASDVQRRFMDHRGPRLDTLSYGARCRQLRELGGDCYDFQPLPDNRLTFAIGDASGKSLPAALMIANVQSSLRTAAYFAGHRPSEVMGAVNRQLYTSSLTDRFATLFYGVFNTDTRVLSYVNAGHNPPLLMRRDGLAARLEISGLPLGMFSDSTYEEGRVHLFPGDVLIAYTDGVTEAVDLSGEQWGEEGLKKAAAEASLSCQARARCADELVDDIFVSLDRFSRGRQDDDATVLVLLSR